jgi:hypothetical protein
VSEENLTPPGAPPRRVRWEYHQIVLTPDDPAPAPDDSPAVAYAVAAAGADGWELATIVPTTHGGRPALLYMFKRPEA